MIYNKDGLDFLKSLDDNSVDLVLTDPPYQISRETGMQKSRDEETGLEKFRIQTKFGEWDEGFDVYELEPFIKEIYRVLKKGGTFICFYDLWKFNVVANICKKTKFKQLRFIEWIKTNPVPVNSKINYLTNSREIAITCVKGGKPIFNSEYNNGIYEHSIYQGKTLNGIKERIHPTQKPVDLFRELINIHSVSGDLVIDPFSGSGTTAIAALLENRRCMSSELSKEYYDKSIERIKTFYPEMYQNDFSHHLEEENDHI